MPRTHLGKWPVGLIIIFFSLFATFLLLVASGQRGGDTFFSNQVLSITGLLMGLTGVLAFLQELSAL